MIGLLAQIYNIFTYCVIISKSNVNLNLNEVFLIVPIIELFGQIAILIPSIYDMATIFIFSLLNLTLETSLFIALFYKIGDLLSIGINSIIIEYLKIENKICKFYFFLKDLIFLIT